MVRDGTLELRSEVHEVHTQTHRHMDTQTHGVRPPFWCPTSAPFVALVAHISNVPHFVAHLGPG